MKEVKTENGQNEEREKGWMKWKEGKRQSGMKEKTGEDSKICK